jgi:hypothetical protein
VSVNIFLCTSLLSIEVTGRVFFLRTLRCEKLETKNSENCCFFLNDDAESDE